MTTLALIGVGNWGKNYLHAVKKLKNTEIKYVYSRSQQTLSLEDLLHNKQIDGFIIATPASTHFAIAKQFLSLGRNLLIEKPLTINYNQALQLHRIWQMKKPQVLIGHTYLYNPAYQVFKKLFKSIKKVKSVRFEGLMSPIRQDVSVIWDWGPHPVSILLDLIQKPVTKVRATGSNHTVNAVLQFSNGIQASFDISWFGPHKARRLTIESKDAKIELDDTNTTNQKVIMQKTNLSPQYPEYKKEAALTEELTEFIEAIQGFKKIKSDINMGVEVVKILSATEQSVKKDGQSILFSKQSMWL